MIIGIDPGHGGTNHGCTGCGLHEEHLTLETGLQLRTVISAMRPTWHILMTRVSDETVHFEERAKRLSGSDLVLSIHYDTSPAPLAGHMATYTFPGDTVSQGVAKHILAVAPPALAPPTLAAAQHLVSQDDWTVRAYNVLQAHRPTPALLVEVGFLSNPAHVAAFGTTAGMAQVCGALASGLCELDTLIGPAVMV